MFKNKYKQIKTSPNKSNLDQVLWFIENFLPQKKSRGVQKNSARVIFTNFSQKNKHCINNINKLLRICKLR